MLYIGYFIVVKNYTKFPFSTHRVENRLSNLCAHQMPLDHLKTAILKLLGRPRLRLDGPGGHYMGPNGCASTRIVIK